MKYGCNIASVLFLILFLSVLNTGCKTSSTEKKDKKDKKVKSIFDNYGTGEQQKPETRGDISRDAVTPFKFAPETNDSEALRAMGQKGSEEHTKVKTPFYEKYLKKEDADKKIPVKINFDAASIADIVPAFSQVLGFNYLIDPQVKGAVTMTVNSELSKREIWQIFEQILWLSGAYCSPDADIVHILPFSLMPRERRLLTQHRPQANVEVLLVGVKNTSSKDLLEKIKPFLTEGATAIDIPHQNALLLVEAPSNIPKLRSLINMLDIKNKANWPQVVIRCTNVSAARIRDELTTILPILGFPVTTDETGEPGAVHLVSIERLQVLIASAANREALEELKNWASVLDRSDVGEQDRVYIYNVVNGKAEELSQTLSVIFNTETSTVSSSSSSSLPSSSGSSSSSSSSSSSTASNAGKSASKPSTSTTTTGTKKTSGSKSKSSGDGSGPANIYEVPVKIVSDSVQNRLIIRTTPRTYAMLKALLTRLDTPASQVLLQVMVAEIRLTNDTQFGLEFTDHRKMNGYESLYGTNYNALVPGSSDQYGLSYWVFQSQDPNKRFAYIKALAGKGKVEVISSPQLLVKSDVEAKISVGNKVPIVTSEITDTQSSTADNTAVKRSIQYEDTGIILTIIPHVTKGGLITFELEQIVSDAIRNTSSEIDSPEIQERVVRTALSLRDGKTLIIGGLIRERVEDTQNTVPFVSDIPLLGRLVGNNQINKVRTELIVLITGRIITEKTKLEELTSRYRQAMKSIKKLEEWENSVDPEKEVEIDTAKRLLNLK